MATRSMFKLFSKAYFQLPSCSSTISTLPYCGRVSVRHNRSSSQPNHSIERSGYGKKFLQIRKVSRSLQNLKENRTDCEKDEEVSTTEDDVNEMRLIDFSAREIKKPEVVEEVQEQSNPIYEVTDGYRSSKNVYDVFNYMKNVERQKALTSYAHLQPNNLKPYGSTENLLFPSATKKLKMVSYPTIGIFRGSQDAQASGPSTKVDENYLEDSVLQETSSPNLAETKKLTLAESKPNFDINTKRFSTNLLTARKISNKSSKKTRIPRLSLSSHFLKKSNSYFTVKKKQSKKLEINELSRRVSTHKEPEMNKKKAESFIRSDSFNDILSLKSKTNRPYNTQCAKPKKSECSEYITIKLGDLCQSSKKCKPKKFRLPKLDAGTCPCIDPPAIQPSKPLKKLKKRPVQEPEKVCLTDKCIPADRADFNMVIKPKKLKPIEAKDCPCVDVVMQEGTPLKRLVAKPVFEPPKICEVVCPLKEERKKIIIQRKRLPVLKPGNCPCIDPEPPLDAKPLKKLVKKIVKEPDRVCPTDECIPEDRADFNMVIKPKKLKPIEAKDCPCVDVVMQEGTPLKRLVAKPVFEPPKICEVVCPLKEERKKIIIKRKKLPILKPGNCPCIDPEPALDVKPLKKLKKKPVKEPERVCLTEECKPEDRADFNLTVKPKKLKPIEVQDCPCNLEILDEGTPLKRLVPKPVVEPPKICEVVCPLKEERKKMIIKRKKLPVLKPGNCPCIDPEPVLDVKPLKKLKKKPVKEPERVCLTEECKPEDRADFNLTVKPKKLKPIEVQDCPCNLEILDEGIPLKRLIAKPVFEPLKICEVVCPLKEARKKEKVERKKLPVLPIGNCPCIDPEPPEDVGPLKKLTKRPVKEPERVCLTDKCKPEDRADVNLTIESKKLPVLKIMDCPCIEAKPPENVEPLARLKKKPVCEPPKICPNDNICLETPRADEDDWMYWKRVEVKCEPELEPKMKNTSQTTKRSFSTSARLSKRFYCTSVQSDNFLRLNFDVCGVEKNLKDQKYNIVIDIKPSASLILTQKPIDAGKFLELRKCKSEPGNCTTFIICKNDDFESKEVMKIQSKSSLGKDTDGGLTLFNSINRFISTCSALPKKRDYDLQPRNPILKEREKFLPPFPTDEEIRKAAKKGRTLYRSKEEAIEQEDECGEEIDAVCEPAPDVCRQEEKQLSLWEKIVNFFKARPGCPTPEELRQMRLREAAEKAAAKAGLCLYDPKEQCQKELPKVLTAATIKKEMK